MLSLSKMNISIVLVTICVINILNTSAIQIIDGKYSLDSQIDPIVNKEECDSYYAGNNKLCDMNKYLTYPMKQKVGEMMESAKHLPIISCPFKTDGIEFGVFIMSSFNDYHSIKMNEENYDIQEASKFYAKLFHEKWEIGNEECNNGILIFLNVNDRFIYISTSTYLKMNYISDQWINDNLLPSIRHYLKDGEYGEAIINLMESITDKCQQVTVDKMIESEQKLNTEKLKRKKLKKNNKIKNSVNSQNDIHHDHHHNNHYHHSHHHNHQEVGASFWTIMIIIFCSVIFLIWFIKSCCSNDEEYNDEGRPSQPLPPQPEPGAYPQAQPGIIRNQRNAGMERNNHLRSRNVRNVRNVKNVNVYNQYYQYPKQQFSSSTTTHCDNNSDRLNKERKEKQRAEKERKEKKLKEENSKLVDNGKRTGKNGGGGGMSWGNCSSSEKEKQTKQKLKEKNQTIIKNAKRTANGGGGGMSWGNSFSSSSSSAKASPKYKRTDDNAGAGGSW